ncbi:MAG: hypothetical protein ACYTG2_04470 [Planctomycetota bacterium]|jgi:hypothetical protein
MVTAPQLILHASFGAVLLAACASAQTSEVPDETAPLRTEAKQEGVTARVPVDDAATAALARAVRFQRGETPRAAPRSLHGRFYVGVRDQDGTMIKADVERWYTVRPERMLTTRTEKVTGSTSSVGYDGEHAWFRDRASGDTVVYTDDPGTFDEDLAQLREQMRLTRLLLDAIVLDALVPRLVEPRIVATRTVEDLDGNEHEVEIVAARVPDDVFGAPPGAPPPAADDPPLMLALELGIDSRTGAPWTLAVGIPHRPDLVGLDLRFDFFGSSHDGLQVPGNIRVFRTGEARERMTLGVELVEVEGGKDRLVLDVDAEPDPALFAVPR